MNKNTLKYIDTLKYIASNPFVQIYALLGFVMFFIYFTSIWLFKPTTKHCDAVQTKDLPYVAECVNNAQPQLRTHYTNKYCRAVANKEIPHSSAFCDLCVKDKLLKNQCNEAMMQKIISNN